MDKGYLEKFVENRWEDSFELLCRSDFNEKMAASLLDLSEQYLIDWESPMGWHKRNLLLLIEAVQNIHRHSPSTANGSWKNNHFFISGKKEGFEFYTSNGIDAAEEEDLKERIQKLHAYSTDELKEAYHHQIKYGEESKKGGAGLGLMFMKRKSHHMDTQISPLSNGSKLFELKLWHKLKENEFVLEEFEKGLETEATRRKEMKEQNIILLYHGKFSDDLIGFFLEICRFIPTEEDGKSHLYQMSHVLVELLQNIRKHSESGESEHATLAIAHQGNSFQISTLNKISQKVKADLLDVYEKYSNLTHEQQVKAYEESLQEIDTKQGIGLLDVLRVSQGKLDLSFFTNSESDTFAEIQTTITPGLWG